MFPKKSDTALAVVETPETPETPATVDPVTGGEGEGEGEREPVADAVVEARQPTIALVAKSKPHDLARVMTRIFDTPLLIDAAKLDVILAAIGPRLHLIGGMPESFKVVPAEGAANVSAFGGDDHDDETPYDVTSDGIALISVDGTLVYKSSWLGSLSGMTSYSSISDAVNQAVADPSVKGILLQVGSYGGEASGCFDASDAIFAARSLKPIYGVASDMAYSGGYALLSSASKVFVSRTSGVGSVGVCCAHVDQSAQDKMDGLKYTYVYSGDRKIDGNPHQALSPEARVEMQAESDRLRAIFAGSVAKYRGLSVDAVIATQAGKFFGENAVSAKLADAVGTPLDALAALRADLAAKAQSTVTLEAAPVVVVEAPPAPTAEVAAEVAAALKEPVRVSEVIDLDSIREKVRGESAAHHLEIAELCNLADEPQLAAEFIRSGKSIAQVRDALQMRRVEASNARTISGHHSPDAGIRNPKAAADGWDKAIVKVCGKLKEN